MKRIFKIAILCMALMLATAVCSFAAELTVTSSVNSQITLSDAKTKAVSVSGTYEAGAMVTLEITNTATGEVVLSQQADCADDATFTVSGIMSDKVTVGTYELKLGATGLSTAQTSTFNVVEAAGETEEAAVEVTVTNGSATVKVDGVDKETAPALENYPVGSVLTYTATPADANKVFLYWQDAVSNVVLSTTETMEVSVGSDAEYVAVYADKTAEVYVTFTSNNRILASGLKGAIAIPANPYIAGYTFNGWYVGGVKTEATLDVSENTVWVAGFVKNSTEYDVTITGANEAGDKYKYNDKVTVTPAGEAGKVFIYWTRDGEIVSYSETYSFYVSGATTVVANYADTAAEQQIVLVMAEPTVVGDNLDKIAFYAERNVPSNYTVLETGIILSQSADFNLDTAGILKAKASSTANIGQYTVRKANVTTGQTWYAKAYLIYSDGVNTATVYSEPAVSKTL